MCLRRKEKVRMKPALDRHQVRLWHGDLPVTAGSFPDVENAVGVELPADDVAQESVGDLTYGGQMPEGEDNRDAESAEPLAFGDEGCEVFRRDALCDSIEFKKAWCPVTH